MQLVNIDKEFHVFKIADGYRTVVVFGLMDTKVLFTTKTLGQARTRIREYAEFHQWNPIIIVQ
jgi:hypothetical protein